MFFIGSLLAVSIPCEDNFILAKNLPQHGTTPGSSLLSTEELLSCGPPGEAFWPSGAAEGQPASGAQIGFWLSRLLLTVSLHKRPTDEHRWTPVLRSSTADDGQILKAGFGISFAFLRVAVQ